MRVLSFLITFFALWSVVFSTPAAAQENVKVRTGTHTGYERIVFEWPQIASYTLSKDGERILLRFARAGVADLSDAQGSDIIGAVETTSTTGEPLQVSIAIPSDSRLRDFTVGSKVIIDVYASKDKKAEAPVKATTKAEPVTAAPVTDIADKKQPAVTEPQTAPEKAMPAKKQDDDFTHTAGEPAAAVPVHDVEAAKIAPIVFDPHVITLTTVTSVGMTVFERSGWLWIVIDNAELPAAPQLTGPQKERLPPLEKIDVPDGAGWRMDLPEGMNVYAEGGGLSWRVILTPKARAEKPALAVADDANGALLWKLRDMRRQIAFTDPVIGDKIVAIIATSADQYAGQARDFVNLSTLDSVAGLAFLPKSDDVKAEIKPDHVTISRPGGLALSRAADVQPEKIRKALDDTPVPEEKSPEPAAPSKEETAEKTDLPEAPPADPHAQKIEEHAAAEAAVTKENLAQIAQEKPQGNNIYNFPRWEMGGTQALYNNEHVMMVELANKSPEKQPEDIITMAKLLLANHRGPEALGMMRIALLKVPELDENTEFSSLRGAALAISGKYDEAILDFSHEKLKNFDDVKYWRAYTLAGLEDWRQAIDTMPRDMTPIAAYPAVLRTPMLLTFAEVALRGGQLELAQGILDILKSDAPRMPLAYASAMTYLDGEAKRQSGDVKGAVEAWEPLVKNGKDDLYRAKAGLSLTKLQLDQKMITPAQAIERLEGMRYAWRGDELETLINYRLGQLYIDNRDYLKGLTVLRNAVTLSPGSEIGKEVRDYMVKAYRDIFANDRLGNISPLEAISIHEEFRNLTSPGDEGDKYVEKLAERLVDADLLGRAAALLEYQVNNRLQGDRKAGIAIRLAAIRLLDGNADGALRALEVAQDTLDRIDGKVPVAATPAAAVKPQDIKTEAGEPAKTASAAPVVKADPEKQRQVYLLKARALSMKNKADESLEILAAMRPDVDVNRLRTDIAWKAGKWEEAAMALGDLIVSEDISPKNPLTDYQRDIILNRAIALNLSGNRVALANLRERYNAQIKGTTKGQMFEVVTRPRRPDMIGSREAITSMISEIDLFSDFLGSYAKMQEGDKPDAVKESAAPKEPVPADGAKVETPEPAAASPAAETKPASDGATPAEKTQ